MTINDYEALLHEIKNVICVVSCSLQLMEKQHPEVQEYTFWSDTASDLAGLRMLLAEIADTHCCDLPHKEKVNMDRFLQEVKSACPKADSAEHAFIIHADSEISEGFFDALRIQHALLRILDNAFNALHENGTVQMNVFSDCNSVIFEVKDNGKGIAREALARVCQPFYGSGNGKNGLGLFISKSIVDSHNGTLTIDSEPDKGTTVRIALPYDH